MMEILGYIAAFIMGVTLGSIGGGGSILTVPILVYLMGVTPVTATGYSLLIVGSAAAFGAFRYYRQGLIDMKAAITFAIPSIVAVYLTRAFLMPAIPDEPPPINESTRKVNPGKLWTIYRRGINGAQALHIGADHRAPAAG
ncbi:TSUP family transporter [Micavibrio aeruginosavorus]|uniref:TSUP family transporter n=1 Tax=Micavibrio aeruginosavorus TaxID=349221 RepID=UPI003F4A8AD1